MGAVLNCALVIDADGRELLVETTTGAGVSYVSVRHPSDDLRFGLALKPEQMREVADWLLARAHEIETDAPIGSTSTRSP